MKTIFTSKHQEHSYAYKIEKELWEKTQTRIVDLCCKLGYPDINRRIMLLDETVSPKEQQMAIKKDKELLSLYLKFSKDEYSNLRKGTNRSWTEYFKQLITGWVEEDLFLLMLNANGISSTRNGRDSDRKIKIGNNISQSPDLQVQVGDKVRKLELSNEYNDFLINNGFIEKRSPAIVRMWQEGVIWLYRDRKNKQYVLIDFANEDVIVHLRHHNTVVKDWAKDVNRYVLSENGKVVRDDTYIIAELTTVIGGEIRKDGKPQLKEIEDKDSPPMEYTVGGKKKANPSYPQNNSSIVEIASSRHKPSEENTNLPQGNQPKLSKRTAQPKQPLTPPPISSQEEDEDCEVSSVEESDIDGDLETFRVDDGGFV